MHIPLPYRRGGLLILQCEDVLYVGSYSVPLKYTPNRGGWVGGEIIPPLPPGGHRCGWEIPWHIGVIKGEDTGENGTGDARGGEEHLPQPAHIYRISLNN